MKRVSCVILFLGVAGILFSQSFDFKVYPNPIKRDGVLHIEAIDSLLPPLVKIYSYSGALVRVVDIGYGNTYATVSFLGLAHGIYLVWLDDYNKNKKRR